MTPQILVCDDEPHVIRAISLRLSRADFDVKGVLDVDSCWRWLEQHSAPALLIIDDALPTPAATADFLARIRREQRFADLSVIRLVAGQDESFHEQFEFEDVLAKPFSSHELFESVCHMLGCDSGTLMAASQGPTSRGRGAFATV
ncbi:response regulator [Schlesneria paludicola]|uniref:response regulator n=1 Tax=Schlesneria paludicola TaxID=360056 RepID=UPI00029A026B|nr:response regulator [Schlesneria paludicola]